MTAALLAATYAHVLPIRSHLGLHDSDTSLSRAIIVAIRRNAPPIAPAAPTSQGYERRNIHGVCDDAIFFQLRQGVRTVLCKGWRLDHGDKLCNFSGSTNRDQLVTREWAGLLGEVGSQRMFELFSSLSLCIFRRLDNACYLQLTGAPFDDELRALLRAPLTAPAAEAAMPTIDGVCDLETRQPSSGAAGHCMPGAWALPRSDARIPAVNRGLGLRYVRPLFYATYPRSPSTRHGLPRWHVLNASRRLTASVSAGAAPSVPERPAAPHQVLAARSGSSLTVSKPTTEAPPRAPSVASAGRICRGPVPPSRNAARRLIHHIFVSRPHITDVAVYNGASPKQLLLMSRLPPPSSSLHPATLSRTHSRQTDNAVATVGMAAGPLPLALVAEANDTAIPGALSRAVPAFTALLDRHRHCRYAVILNTHCPRSDVDVSSECKMSGDAVGRIAGKKRRAECAGSESVELARDQQMKRRRGLSDSNLPGSTIREIPLGSRPVPPVLIPGEQCAAAPLRHVTPHAAVMAFVRSCLARVLPGALWGGNDNRRHILRLVWAWISVGKRDRLAVADLLHGCQVSGFQLLLGRAGAGGGAAEAREGAGAIQAWLAWLLLGFVTPLLRASFYVTDSEVYHHRPLYFRRETWERLSSATMLALRQTLKLLPLDPAAAAAAAGTSSLGVAGMRLSPKRGSLRPIMNMAASHVGIALVERAKRDVATDAAAAASAASAPGTSALLAAAAPAMDTRSTAGGSAVADSPLASARAWLQSAATATTARSVNKQLEAVHEVLKFARRRRPNALGAAVFGLDGIFVSLRRFAAARGARAATAATAARSATMRAPAAAATSNFPSSSTPALSRPLFMFCCDIASAYDSIVQSIAFAHVEELLPRDVERYEVRAYTEVSASGWAVVAPPDVSASVHPETADRAVLQAARTRFRRVAVACDATFVPFHRQVAALAAGSHNTVFLDGSFSESVTHEQCLDAIRKVVWHHQVASPDGLVWRQTRGVPQGSIISSFLCNAYLGGLERRELIPGVAKLLHSGLGPQQSIRASSCGTIPGSHAACERDPASSMPASVLMRLTDDMLLITEDAAVAAAVRAVLCGGVPRYAMRINPAKTQVSFDVGGEGQDDSSGGCAAEPTSPAVLPLRLARTHARPALIAWCGLLFCPVSGAVTSDYSRYLGTGALEDSLSIGFGPAPKEAVLRMARSFLRPKCHPVLLDGHLNSLGTVALNVYQMALIAFAKLSIVLRRLGRGPGRRPHEQLPQGGRVGGGDASSLSLLSTLALRTTLDSAEYLVAIVRRRCPGKLDLSSSLSELEAGGAATADAAPVASPLESTEQNRREPGSAIVGGGGRILFLGPSATWNLDEAAEVVLPQAHGGAEGTGLPGTGAHEMGVGEQEAGVVAWCPLRNAEVRWLALAASIRVFQRVQARFPGVVAELLRARMLDGGQGIGDAAAAAAAGSAVRSRVRLSIRSAASQDLTPWAADLDF